MYGSFDHVRLGAAETFDGQNYTMDLTDMTAYTGLFRISHSLVKIQKWFGVDHCSSPDGSIEQNCGGIAGMLSGSEGEQVMINNSLFTGDIEDSGVASLVFVLVM
eukprot:gb/GECG01004672.1/.p1 GENE.gb/GECG01004672.1/~~gb/GECG01004672.1/.p1  ORF type:complete len:105 (+),score=10.33 gb/GECG01004672.1/:1-315(+)